MSEDVKNAIQEMGSTFEEFKKVNDERLEAIEKGESTACVSVCPTHCMYFGDLDDPSSEVSKALRNRKYKTLAPEAGTNPQIFYLI